MSGRSIQKQITVYKKQYDIIDSIDKLHKFNSSKFFRWSLCNKLQEYLDIKD